MSPDAAGSLVSIQADREKDRQIDRLTHRHTKSLVSKPDIPFVYPSPTYQANLPEPLVKAKYPKPEHPLDVCLLSPN